MLTHLLLPLLLLPLLSPQGSSERNEALAGPSYVPVVDANLQRQLNLGLALLDKGKGREALGKVLPILRSPSQDPGLPYGARETRSFHLLLQARLARCSEATRVAFAGGLEDEAARVLARLPRAAGPFRSFLRSYPGTKAFDEARKTLLALLLESGDWVAASRLAAAQGSTAAAREMVLALRDHERQRHPWAHVDGNEDGSPTSATIQLPAKGKPVLRGQAGGWQLASAFARGIVGKDSEGREFAVFQDPLRLQILEGKAREYARKEINLALMTGLSGGEQEPPGPALSGSRLFLVHGGGSTRRLGRRTVGSVPELFALDLAKPERPRACWRWSPASEVDAPFSKDSRLRPRVLAAGTRVFALLVDPRDRVNVRVHLCCFAQEQAGEGKGFAKARMLWSQLLAKGSPLSASLLRSRQEDLELSDLRPAAPILHQGVVFAGTGLGVLAAVDAGTGDLLWTFRTARAKTSSTQTWRNGKISIQGDTLLYTPSDGQWLYRLHCRPGARDAMVGQARQARSLSRLLGVDTTRPRSFFLRGEAPAGEDAVQEIRPLYLDKDDRYDAPPLEGRGRLMAAPLLTRRSLFLPTRNRLYCLDLARGLYYTKILGVPNRHPLGAMGPILPFEGQILVGSVLGPLAFE